MFNLNPVQIVHIIGYAISAILIIPVVIMFAKCFFQRKSKK
jgi:hypothetical protein